MKNLFNHGTARTRRGPLSLGLLALAMGALVLAPLGNLAADEDQAPGKITFVGKNTLMTANGTFHAWHFTKVLLGSGDTPVKEVEIEVDVASLDTAIEKRDNHLRTADFFDVENFPAALLRIYDIAAAGDDAYTAKLDFNMHGVQKTYDLLTFRVTGTDPVQVAGEFAISRMDFKIGEPHKKLNPMSVRDNIPITFTATLPEEDLVPSTD